MLPRCANRLFVVAVAVALAVGNTDCDCGSSPAAPGTFTPTTGSLVTARESPTATLLPSGKVLIVGGYTSGSLEALASAELYDPATGTFTGTGSLGTGRPGFGTGSSSTYRSSLLMVSPSAVPDDPFWTPARHIPEGSGSSRVRSPSVSCPVGPWGLGEHWGDRNGRIRAEATSSRLRARRPRPGSRRCTPDRAGPAESRPCSAPLRLPKGWAPS